MSLVTTKSKMEAAKAFINTWLKDKTLYCANCSRKWKEVRCCEAPYIVDNFTRVADFTQALKEQRSMLDNEFGASKGKNMRYSISMPAELMRALQKYFGTMYNEDFLVDKKEANEFMKMFPQFTACERR